MYGQPISRGAKARVASLARRVAAATDGATAIEYALIASGIALVIVVGIEAVGTGVNDLLLSISPLF